MCLVYLVIIFMLWEIMIMVLFFLMWMLLNIFIILFLFWGFKLCVGLFNIKICGFIVRIFVIVIFFIWLLDILNGDLWYKDLFIFIICSVFLVYLCVWVLVFLKFEGLNLIFFKMFILNNWYFGNWKIKLIFWCKWFILIFFFEGSVVFKIFIFLDVGCISVLRCCISVDLLLFVWFIIVMNLFVLWIVKLILLIVWYSFLNFL